MGSEGGGALLGRALGEYDMEGHEDTDGESLAKLLGTDMLESLPSECNESVSSCCSSAILEN